MRVRKIPAHRWVVIVWSGSVILASIVTAIRGDIGAALGWLFVGGIGLGVAAWHFVSKRDRSDDPDTYGLRQYNRDIGEDV